jgi:hypothetical protein
VSWRMLEHVLLASLGQYLGLPVTAHGNIIF